MHVLRFVHALPALILAVLALPLQAAPAPPSLVQALKAAPGYAAAHSRR